MSFAVGSLVKARGREWVVLPESDEQMLVLRSELFDQLAADGADARNEQIDLLVAV